MPKVLGLANHRTATLTAQQEGLRRRQKRLETQRDWTGVPGPSAAQTHSDEVSRFFPFASMSRAKFLGLGSIVL